MVISLIKNKCNQWKAEKERRAEEIDRAIWNSYHASRSSTDVAAMTGRQFEEFLAREAKAGALRLPLKPVAKRALLHGHCHQKSFAAMGAVENVLRLVPDLALDTVESSCCGMAGAFGYGADTIDVSLKMAELSLLPAVRKADADTLICADGVSCRHQIKHGSGREALHVARVLAMGLDAR